MCEENWLLNYSMEQMRMQRHDFMNYLQVIYGYIQLDRSQDAVYYIKKINNKMMILSQIFNLECPYFAILMQEFIEQLDKHNINIEFKSKIECIPHGIFSKNIEIKRKTLSEIKAIIVKELRNLKKEENKLYIEVKSVTLGVSIIMGTDAEMVKMINNPESIIPFETIVSDKETGHIVKMYKKGNNTIIEYNIY